MNISDSSTATTTASVLPSGVAAEKNASAMTVTDPETNTVAYVWVPYAFFLVGIFIILAFSFAKHKKRSLRRRRVMLDYLEADVLAKRPRICRMFSASMGSEDANTFFKDRNLSSSSDQHVASFHPHPSLPPFSGGDECGRCPRGLRGSHDPHLQIGIPTLGNMGMMPPNGYYCFEDSGQSLARPLQNRALYGHSNMAFSFDEDLGRYHTRRVISLEQHPFPQGPGMMHREGRASTRHNYMDVIDSEHESQHSNITCGNNKCSSGSHSVSSASRDDPRLVGAPALNPACSEEDASRAGLPASSDSAERSGTCSHCGSLLPTSSGARPKKKPRYKRQSACSDSFEVQSGPDLSLFARATQESDTKTPSLSSEPVTENGMYPCSIYSERTSSTLRGSRPESGSTNITTLSTDSRTTARTNSTIRSKKRSASQRSSIERMAKGLEVYTIEMSSSHAPMFEAAARQSSLPESGSMLC